MTINPKKEPKTTCIKVMSCSLPRLGPYNKLVNFLNEADKVLADRVLERVCVLIWSPRSMLMAASEI